MKGSYHWQIHAQYLKRTLGFQYLSRKLALDQFRYLKLPYRLWKDHRSKRLSMNYLHR